MIRPPGACGDRGSGTRDTGKVEGRAQRAGVVSRPRGGGQTTHAVVMVAGPCQPPGATHRPHALTPRHMATLLGQRDENLAAASNGTQRRGAV